MSRLRSWERNIARAGYVAAKQQGLSEIKYVWNMPRVRVYTNEQWVENYPNQALSIGLYASAGRDTISLRSLKPTEEAYEIAVQVAAHELVHHQQNLREKDHSKKYAKEIAEVGYIDNKYEIEARQKNQDIANSMLKANIYYPAQQTRLVYKREEIINNLKTTARDTWNSMVSTYLKVVKAKK